jgi:pantothenate synthetase
VRENKTVAVTKLKTTLTRYIGAFKQARLDYLEIFDPKTLKPTKQATHGSHLALAVYYGKTRLIDNGEL